MTSQTTPPDDGDDASESDLYKTMVRLVAGGVGEGMDRLMEVSSQLDVAEDATNPAPSGPFATNPTAMAVVGWLSEMPQQMTAASDAATRMAYPVTRLAGVMLDTAAVIVRSSGIGPFFADLTLPTRRAIIEEIDRLTTVGSAEYARGRVLATEVFAQSVDGIVGYLSDSDEVGDLIREQTLGFAGGAVQEVRETGAAADGLTEGIFRKIFGRDIASLPPKPVFDGE